ncbi:MAG: Uma2 family endonuclease [Oscillospiraceae bacterium]|jgi:Uma2 family endonuclease|nr:Uma2 family endonuclease [Oscillospiraceae bacterium]
MDTIDTMDTGESYVSEAARDAAYSRRGQRYTYSDYVTWDDEFRWELIDGEAYLMSAPSRWHQKRSGSLFAQLYNFLRGHPCEVYIAPFDIRMNFDTEDNTVVQPDVVVICDKKKMDDKGGLGAPEFVVEVLSPSTSKRDRMLKYNLYKKYGVKEYWIIDPIEKTLAVNILSDGDYITRAYTQTDNVPVQILKGCTIDLAEVFED